MCCCLCASGLGRYGCRFEGDAVLLHCCGLVVDRGYWYGCDTVVGSARASWLLAFDWPPWPHTAVAPPTQPVASLELWPVSSDPA